MNNTVTPQSVFEEFPTMFSSKEETELLELLTQKVLKSNDTISEFVDVTNREELVQLKDKVQTYLNQKNELMKSKITNEFYDLITQQNRKTKET